MYNNDSDSLNAGAPDIRLSGNQQMASDPSGGAELFQMYQNALQSGQLPKGTTFEMFKELLQQSQAPQQNSGIMAAAPGTYTQNRKRQMAAGGGIMGSNNGSMLVAPTADGSRPGYAWYDFIVDPVKDFVTEKALPFVVDKAPDFLTDLLGGGKDQPQPRPDYGPYSTTPPYVPEMQQDPWYKTLAQTIIPGGETGYYDLYNTGAQASESTGTPPYFPRGGGADVFEMLGGGGGDNEGGGSQFDDGFRKALATILPGGDPGYVEGGLYNSLLGLGGGITNALSPYLGEGEGRRVNPLYPLGIGAAVGKYVSGLPKDTLPMDTTSIDPAAIATAARGTDAEGAAAGLRFLPEQVTRAAEGGRIGYADSGLAGSSEAAQAWADLEAGINEPAGDSDWTAQGGIGGENPEFSRQVQAEIEKRQAEYMNTVDASTLSQLELDKIALRTKAEMWGKYKQGQAHGGRIDSPLTGRSRYI